MTTKEPSTEVVVDAPAIGYSILANLGDNRQMTIQCFVREDEEPAAIHAKIDRVMNVVDRQRARYEVVDLRKELDTHEKTLARFEEDVARHDEQLEKTLAEFDVAIVTVQGDLADAEQKARAAWAASGRRGDFKGQGAFASQKHTAAATIKSMQDEKQKLRNERDVAVGNLQTSIARFKEEAGKLRVQIAECEALIGSG